MSQLSQYSRRLSFGEALSARMSGAVMQVQQVQEFQGVQRVLVDIPALVQAINSRVRN